MGDRDMALPHWLGSADGRAVELLILFDPQGVRTHVHADPHRPSGKAAVNRRSSRPAARSLHGVQARS